MISNLFVTITSIMIIVSSVAFGSVPFAFCTLWQSLTKLIIDATSFSALNTVVDLAFFAVRVSILPFFAAPEQLLFVYHLTEF